MKLSSFLTALLLSFPNSLVSQQATSPPAASSAQATTLLARSAAALIGSGTLNDVTLSGTARRIAGSTDESGTVTLKALATGESRMDLVCPQVREPKSDRSLTPVPLDHGSARTASFTRSASTTFGRIRPGSFRRSR